MPHGPQWPDRPSPRRIFLGWLLLGRLRTGIRHRPIGCCPGRKWSSPPRDPPAFVPETNDRLRARGEHSRTATYHPVSPRCRCCLPFRCQGPPATLSPHSISSHNPTPPPRTTSL